MATDMPTSPCAFISFATKTSTIDPTPDVAGPGRGGHDCADDGALPPPQAVKPQPSSRRVVTIGICRQERSGPNRSFMAWPIAEASGEFYFLSSIWTVSRVTTPTISRLLGLSLSTVSCVVCQKTLL